MGRGITPDDILEGLKAVAETYDRTSKILTLCLDNRFRQEAVGKAAPSRILDVGSGSGAMIKHARRLYRDSYIVALEPLPQFLELLSKTKTNPDTEIVQGYIEYAPFRHNSFDTITAGFMLRDVTSLSRAIAMMIHISKKRIVILDFWRPNSPLLLLIEVIYVMLIMLLVAAAAPRSIKRYLVLVKTLLRVPPLRGLIKVLSAIGTIRIKCWALCILFSIVVEHSTTASSFTKAYNRDRI